LRKVFGKMGNAAPLSLRIMPFLSVVLLIAFFGLFIIKRDDVWTLGVCSWVTVGIMLSSIAFALAAAASLVIVHRQRSAPIKRMSYWHSALVAAAVAGVAVYMGYWGLIGLRLWV
jgi:hypothetical protein